MPCVLHLLVIRSVLNKPHEATQHRARLAFVEGQDSARFSSVDECVTPRRGIKGQVFRERRGVLMTKGSA